ncbi:MAG: hypothetical protein JWR52_3310 [Marmoricola sp.]|nr:hypothetical protein [Marmoricola sp.]
MAALSRRALLLGGSGAVAVSAVGVGGLLVEHDVLPGRVRLDKLLGLDGASAPIPDVTPGARYDGSFTSAARRGAQTAWSLSVPPGVASAGLPLLVCLHGAGGDHRAAFDDLGIDRFLAQATAAGVPPFAVASVDGGEHSYWHPRADGSDAGAMVTDELIPLLRKKLGLGARCGLYGWSMGGFGALRLAMRGAGAAAVVACSPALFTSYPSSAPGAFDDEADFRRQGLHDQGALFPHVPVRIDIGRGDPFYVAVRDFVAQMSPAPAGGFEAGDHTDGYWRRMLPDQLAFVGSHLA